MEYKPQDTVLKPAALWMSAVDPKDAPSEIAEVRSVLERAIAGDSAAFEQLIVRYERRIVTLAWRLLGNLDDAKDVTQEVFLRAFKYLHRYDPGKPIEGWLVRIAVNVCRDFGRGRRRALTLRLDSARRPQDPYSDLALDEKKQILDLALRSLSERERSSLILRDLEGFSATEVSSLLGLSPSGVRGLIARGRVKMRAIIVRMKGGRP
jgi:RNA polymerase sigma-70 factor (ECF subfamily)